MVEKGYLNASVVEESAEQGGDMPVPLYQGQVLRVNGMSILARVEKVIHRRLSEMTVSEMLCAGFPLPLDVFVNLPKTWLESETPLTPDADCRRLDEEAENGNELWQKAKDMLLQKYQEANGLLSSDVRLTVIKLRPYGLFDQQTFELIRDVVYIDQHSGQIYYFDSNAIFRRAAGPYGEARLFYSDSEISELTRALGNLLRSTGGYRANDRHTGMIYNILSHYLGRSKGAIEKALGKRFARMRAADEREARYNELEAEMLKKYPNLFRLNSPSLIFTPRLAWTVNDEDFYICIPLRKYCGAYGEGESLTISECSAFLRANRASFFRYLGERINADERLLNKIGDLAFYRMTDCIVRSSYEVEMIYSPKRGSSGSSRPAANIDLFTGMPLKRLSLIIVHNKQSQVNISCLTQRNRQHMIGLTAESDLTAGFPKK